MNEDFKKVKVVNIQNINLNDVFESIEDFTSKNHERKNLIVITGPTASGKTDLSIEIAKRFGNEIISADSRQVYKRMDIGTNKISGYVELCYHGFNTLLYESIPHFMINILEPGKDYSVSEYVKEARKIIHKIYSSGKTPLIVGGTGYYIKSLIENKLFANYEVTEEIKNKVNEMSLDDRKEFLKQNDPEMLEYLDVQNPRRLQNPIEYILSIGKKFSEIYLAEKLEPYNALILRPEAPSEILYARADKKLDDRFEMGMIEEVRGLLDSGINPEWLKKIGLEYKYITMYLQNELKLEEMKEQLKFATHHFIKRQLTYMRKYL